MDTHPDYDTQGGLVRPEPITPVREVYLMQRKKGRLGSTLNKTSGWVHRTHIDRHGVKQLNGIAYEKITNEGIWITNADGHSQLLRVDTIVVCAGQESINDLMPQVGDTVSSNLKSTQYHIIGGAKLAGELDAKRAIREGAKVGASL